MYDHGWSLWALLLLCAAGGQVAEQRSRLGRLLSAPLVSMLLAAGLAATGVIPFDCASYGVVWDYLMPMAAACFLLETDLAKLVTTGGPTLTAFVIGSAGMVAGSLLGWHLLSAQLGATGWKVVACLCASYVGGSVNFAAVAKVIGLSPSTIPSAMAADNLAMAAYLAVLMSVPVSNIVRHASSSLRTSLASREDHHSLSSAAAAPAGPSHTCAAEPQLAQLVTHAPKTQQHAAVPVPVRAGMPSPSERELALVKPGDAVQCEACGSSSSSSISSSVPDVAHHSSLLSGHSSPALHDDFGDAGSGIPTSDGQGRNGGAGTHSNHDRHSAGGDNKHAHSRTGNGQDRTVTHDDHQHACSDTSTDGLEPNGSGDSGSSSSSDGVDTHASSSATTGGAPDSPEEQLEAVTLSGHHLSIIFAAAAFSCASAQHIAAALSIPSLSMLVMAGVATCVASAAQQHRKHAVHSTGATLPPSIFAGSSEVGSALMTLFFTVIGASAGDLHSLAGCGWLVAQLTVMVSVHWVVLTGVGAVMLRLPRQALLIGSNACIGGPATAAAMAMSKGWSHLVQPALMTGSLGYAVGTGAGLLVAKIASGG
ncbi:MAG: hypothetical protein WDW36_000191 [Sanguina aurantia]